MDKELGLEVGQGAPEEVASSSEVAVLTSEEKDPWSELAKVEFAGDRSPLSISTTSPDRTCRFYLKEIERQGNMEGVRNFLEGAMGRDYLSFREPEELAEFAGGYVDELRESLDPEEKSALKRYSGIGYQAINQVARGQWSYELLGLQTPERVESVEETIKGMDRAMATAPELGQDVMTYRGTTRETFLGYGIDTLGDLAKLEGQFFLEKGFCSTSLIRERDFTNAATEDGAPARCNVEIVYRIPKEYHECVGLLSEDLAYHSEECEFLVNRNSLSYVAKAEVDEAQNQAKLEMVLIPREVYDPGVTREK